MGGNGTRPRRTSVPFELGDARIDTIKHCGRFHHADAISGAHCVPYDDGFTFKYSHFNAVAVGNSLRNHIWHFLANCDFDSDFVGINDSICIRDTITIDDAQCQLLGWCCTERNVVRIANTVRYVVAVGNSNAYSHADTVSIANWHGNKHGNWHADADDDSSAHDNASSDYDAAGLLHSTIQRPHDGWRVAYRVPSRQRYERYCGSWHSRSISRRD